MSTDTTLVSGPAPSRAWLVLLGPGPGTLWAPDLLSGSRLGPAALRWDAIRCPRNSTGVEPRDLFYGVVSPLVPLSVSTACKLGPQVPVCSWVMVRTWSVVKYKTSRRFYLHIRAVHMPVERRRLETCQPEILVSLSSLPGGSQQEETDVRNVSLKTKQ